MRVNEYTRCVFVCAVNARTEFIHKCYTMCFCYWQIVHKMCIFVKCVLLYVLCVSLCVGFCLCGIRWLNWTFYVGFCSVNAHFELHRFVVCHSTQLKEVIQYSQWICCDRLASKSNNNTLLGYNSVDLDTVLGFDTFICVCVNCSALTVLNCSCNRYNSHEIWQIYVSALFLFWYWYRCFCCCSFFVSFLNRIENGKSQSQNKLCWANKRAKVSLYR